MRTDSATEEMAGLVLHYLDARRTAKCVLSMLHEGVVEVLVWDNSSDNGESLAQLVSSLGGNERVTTGSSGTNLGFAAGVNRGLVLLSKRRPNCPVLLLNNDATLLPGGGRDLTYAIAANPAAALIFPKIDNGGYIAGVMYYQPLFGILSRNPLPGSIAHASGCCLVIRPWKFEGAVLDEEFFMYGEDVELGHRLGLNEAGMVHVPMVLVEHEGSASSGMASDFYESRMVAAHLILARKLATNFFVYVSMLALRALTLSMRALVRGIRYRSFMPLRALLHGWRIAFS